MEQTFYHRQTSEGRAAAIKKRDADILRRAIPPYMMLLACKELRKKGESIRADMEENLEKASVAPLADLDMLSVSRLAKQVEETATNILKDVSPDSPHDLLLATSYLMLRLVEEGYLTDVQNQAVLIGMALIEEAKDEPEHWNYNDKTVARLANNMMTRYMLYGLTK